MKRNLLPILFFAALGSNAFAQAPFQLQDQNSVVTGNAANGLLNGWLVDGVNQLFNQSYYYRIGNTAEAPVWSLGAPTIVQFAPNIVQVSYTANLFKFDILYSLYGGVAGSNTADISEIARVTNLSSGALDFHLFEYDDFDIAGTAGGDRAAVVNSSTIEQWDGGAQAMVGSVPPYSHYEIANFPVTLNKLTDAFADNLSDTTTTNQPGDLAFGMQWDTSIAQRGSFILSKDKRLVTVPEPATLAVIGIGLFALLRRRR